MKLTVGIPNFNGGINLKEAIESCEHIKLPIEDTEILIVDNQSTDDSISIIEKMKKGKLNIRLWQNSTNLGRIGNWNTVLEKAQGDYLILLFTNDKIYEKNNIEEILKILDENQTISLCISALIKKEKNEEKIKKEYFDDIVLCDSKGFSNDSICRGLFPFGTIEKDGICIVDTHETKSSKGGGCLIATATYGSEMSQQVQQLRELRDNQLLQTESGSAFMSTFNDIYYSFSPIIADYERENPLFKEAVKLAITPMISSLSLMENANSESEVLGIGLSVIMLNLGMYLAVPAVVIVGIRKNLT